MERPTDGEIESRRQPRPPTLADSLVAVAALIALVAASFLLFGEEAALGPNQVALTLRGDLGRRAGRKNGHAWMASARPWSTASHPLWPLSLSCSRSAP